MRESNMLKKSILITSITFAVAFHIIAEENKTHFEYYREGIKIFNSDSNSGNIPTISDAIINIEKAISICEEIKPADCDLAVYYNTLGGVYQLNNDNVSAIKAYEKSIPLLLKKWPKGGGVIAGFYKQLAQLYEKEKNNAEALRNYNLALGLYLSEWVSDADEKAKESAKNEVIWIIQFNRNLCIDSKLNCDYSTDSPEKNKRLAWAHEKMAIYLNKEAKLYDAANFHFRQLTLLDPQNVLNWMYLAASYDKLKDYKNSYTAYRKAIELDESNYQIYYFFSRSYASQNDHKNAIENLSKAIKFGFKNKKMLQEDIGFSNVNKSKEFIDLLNSIP